MYHPPQSSNEFLNSLFIDKFTDAIQDLIPITSNVLVASDFNIHINDLSDNDAVIFLDAMSSLGLSQIVSHATHNSGNTLDHMFVEDSELSHTLFRWETSEFLSDRQWIIAEFQIDKIR